MSKKYLVQSSHAYMPWEPPPEHGWKTISSDRAGHQEFDSLDVALRAFEYNSNLARCVWPMRVIDTEGKIYRIYDSECDTRLPGVRWRIIQKKCLLSMGGCWSACE
jgi:hypothetical protein